ncbi:MAG: stage II sporulation protein M [Nanoarchaeota archaeon]|nr:stage II sporulation protein M [Nanoarchaeota archaeon]
MVKKALKLKKSPPLSISTQFKEAKSYLKESISYFYVVIILFILSVLFGYFYAIHLTFLDNFLKQLIEKTQGLNPLEMIFFILQNNIQSTLYGLILGILLGIPTVLNIIMNGAVLGYVLNKVISLEGYSIIWRLFPHGIFEIPAVFIALGLGLKLGATIFSKKADKPKELKRRFYNSINVFLMIVIPLLIIAAIIEALLIFYLG